MTFILFRLLGATTFTILCVLTFQLEKEEEKLGTAEEEEEEEGLYFLYNGSCETFLSCFSLSFQLVISAEFSLQFFYSEISGRKKLIRQRARVAGGSSWNGS